MQILLEYMAAQGYSEALHKYWYRGSDGSAGVIVGATGGPPMRLYVAGGMVHARRAYPLAIVTCCILLPVWVHARARSMGSTSGMLAYKAERKLLDDSRYYVRAQAKIDEGARLRESLVQTIGTTTRGGSSDKTKALSMREELGKSSYRSVVN